MTCTTWNDSARQVLAQVRYAGMRWEVEGSELYLSGTTDALTGAHRAAIDRHRAQLVRILERLPARCVVPHMCCVLGPCDPVQCLQAEPHQEGGAWDRAAPTLEGIGGGAGGPIGADAGSVRRRDWQEHDERAKRA